MGGEDVGFPTTWKEKKKRNGGKRDGRVKLGGVETGIAFKTTGPDYLTPLKDSSRFKTRFRVDFLSTHLNLRWKWCLNLHFRTFQDHFRVS